MTFCIKCRRFFDAPDYLGHACSQQRTYTCPWCEFSGEALDYWGHECAGMVEALALFAAAPAAAAAGGSNQVARPHLSVVRDAPPATSKETP